MSLKKFSFLKTASPPPPPRRISSPLTQNPGSAPENCTRCLCRNDQYRRIYCPLHLSFCYWHAKNRYDVILPYIYRLLILTLLMWQNLDQFIFYKYLHTMYILWNRHNQSVRIQIVFFSDSSVYHYF